jgi:membrane-associated HD superfamily phosphohydrolase
MREEAQAMVGPSYKINDDITQQIIQSLTDDFGKMEDARSQAEGMYNAYHVSVQEGVQGSIDEANTANSAAVQDNSATAQPAAPEPVPTPYEVPAFDAASTEWQAC